ncbi:carboxypeptidase-like regulatory domain-containing protein [Hymenobacter metallilatus]|uniref:carboxypeptidase-like regulatory domain-containing protein n=1 Tax=Hymenobacter metallilatus TaxID=2493666 RepID=UPI00163AABA9|nr:carboxypeptidase regulatory-like domain-containing protein [Hymenobacter metallilatus]
MLLILAGFLFAGSTISSQAQTLPAASTASSTVALTGAVFSNTGQPLAGATVSVAGKKLITASTNSEGFFLLQVPAGVPLRLVVVFPEHQEEQVEIRHPETEKNLVVTLQSLGRQKSKALRARQKKYQRTGQ